jgi:hypothetical protein
MARLNPDGTVTVDGQRYRVRDVEGRWIVERAADGRPVGAFVVEGPLARSERVDVVAEPLNDAAESDANARSVVEAVAGALCTPRSPLPLQ